MPLACFFLCWFHSHTGFLCALGTALPVLCLFSHLTVLLRCRQGLLISFHGRESLISSPKVSQLVKELVRLEPGSLPPDHPGHWSLPEDLLSQDPEDSLPPNPSRDFIEWIWLALLGSHGLPAPIPGAEEMAYSDWSGWPWSQPLLNSKEWVSHLEVGCLVTFALQSSSHRVPSCISQYASQSLLLLWLCLCHFLFLGISPEFPTKVMAASKGSGLSFISRGKFLVTRKAGSEASWGGMGLSGPQFSCDRAIPPFLGCAAQHVRS